MFYRRKLPRTQREGRLMFDKEEKKRIIIPQRCLFHNAEQERPYQLHQDQFQDLRCLHPGAHLHLGFLQSAEIQPRGVSVVISPLRQMQCLAFAQNVRSCCSNVTESQQVKTRSVSQLPSSKPTLGEANLWVEIEAGKSPLLPLRSIQICYIYVM